MDEGRVDEDVEKWVKEGGGGLKCMGAWRG